MSVGQLDPAALRSRIGDLHARRFDLPEPDPTIVADAEALGDPAVLFEALTVHAGALMFVDDMIAAGDTARRAYELYLADRTVAVPGHEPNLEHLFNRLELTADWRGELAEAYRMGAAGVVVEAAARGQDIQLSNMFDAEVALGVVGPATELYAALGWRPSMRASGVRWDELSLARMFAVEGNMAEAARRLNAMIDYADRPDYVAILYVTWAGTFGADFDNWQVAEHAVARLDELLALVETSLTPRISSEQLQLRAELALRDGDVDAARRIADELDDLPLSATFRARLGLLRADAALAVSDPAQALAHLDPIEGYFDIMPEYLRPRFHRLRREALTALGDHAALVDELERDIARLTRPRERVTAEELLGPTLAARLNDTFDGLKERLVGRLRWERGELVEAITHDLASALGVVRLGTGLIDTHTDRVVPALRSATERMRSIVDTFALLVSIDQSRLHPTLEPHTIGALVEPVVANMNPAATAKQIALRYTPAPAGGTTVLADPGFFEMSLANLIGNAVKYSPPDTTVDVRVARPGGNSGAVTVAVTDEGPGLAADEIDTIFERHMRGTARPTGSETSLGLGLYIGRAMCAMMGGQIRAESAGLGHGSTFTIMLPEHRARTEAAE